MRNALRVLVLIAAVAVLAAPASANMITNGGFETGDFTGWTLSGNTGFTTVSTITPYSGNYAARLGPVGSDGFLSQSFVTIPFKPYRVIFRLKSDGLVPNDFSVAWNGFTTFSVSDLSLSSGYLQYTSSYFATSALTTLRFGFRNDPGYLQLDGINVDIVPEPGTLLLVGSGITALALRRRRKA